ncbi:MAG TPA: hypothetical protein VKZ51_01505 [Cyclobacteriaceae bacterium]|nr:hypothetical protein [Cyclobacteriaceae bacterium]
MKLARSLFLIHLIGVGFLFETHGQQITCKQFVVDSTSNVFVLDSLTAINSSIEVQDASGQTIPFVYDSNWGIIRIDFEGSPPDSVEVCFQTFPFSLHQIYSNRNLADDYDSTALFKERKPATEVFDFREEIFPRSNLNKSGNLTRGISFGNSQNVFVNSSLNLQIEGELTDNLKLRASITDQQVPFQPEGNTQQLQDFDNVILELYNDKMSLSAGDIVLSQRRSEFLRYNKNVQGLSFTSNYQISGNWEASSQGGISIAKGKFASTELPVMEGVLGPYKIKGPQNERFVIIMANSEKVFLDGKLLKRGFNNDYTIDYNQGEVTFTTNVLLTQYSRVRIDYEYAERNFSRAILTANHIQENDNVSLYFNFYQEKDNRNKPLFFDLTDEHKILMAGIGHDLEAAVAPSVDSIAFDPNRILYRKASMLDSDGNRTVYYEYSTDPDDAFYALSFTQTGAGKGDYVRQQQLANGVVYAYVPPVQGSPQGDFSIYSALPVPNKKQMVTAGAKISLSPNSNFYTEVALSEDDPNLFSDIDQDQEKGFALKSGFASQKKIDWLEGYLFSGMAEFEYNSKNFSFIDRYRSIEFDRDWSLSPEDLQMKAAEKILTAQLELQQDHENLSSYSFKLRDRQDMLTGVQQTFTLNKKIGNRVLLSNDLFFLDSEVRDLRSRWLRYDGSIQYRSKVLVPGYRYRIDRNNVMAAGSDSTVSTAMNFKEHQLFFTTNDTLSYSFFGEAVWREDKFPVGGDMVPHTSSFTSKYGWRKKFGLHDVQGTFTYRKLSHLSEELPEETTIMGRLDYSSSLLNNNLRNELSYSIGNGRELRREFIFLPVPTGEGTHTWRDDNGDGVQQLNEFYLAINTEEKNFVKIFVPTDEYILAYTTLFNYRLHAGFPDHWREEEGLKFFLQKFSNSTSWDVEKKVTDGGLSQRIGPFTQGIDSESLISARTNLRSTVFFNRSSVRYGLDASYANRQHKQLLTGGFEDMLQEDWTLNTRYHFSPSFNVNLVANAGSRWAASDFMDNRNYEIDQYSLGPGLVWQPSSFFRSTGKYSYTFKKNLANTEIDEKATLNEVELNFRFARAIKTTANAQLKYTNISYNGQYNSPTGYEMLQALTVGNNYTWRLNLLQKIGEGLQMNISYEGRNSEGLERLVHTGRMQVTALF